MIRLGPIALAALMLASAAVAGEVSVTLEPVAGEPNEFFQPATLAAHNATDTTLQSLTIQWQLGGPTFVHAVTIPPGGSQELSVHLPAMTRHQRFRIDAALEAAVPMVTEAEITWPIESVDPSVWIDPQAYQGAEGLDIGWSDSMRRMVWWSAVVGCALLVASMAIPRPKWRLATACVVVVIGLSVACHLASRPPVVTERVAADGATLLLFARRQAEWSTQQSGLTPVYATRAQMMDDDTVYEAGGVSVTLTPGQVRLFRLADAPDP